VYLRFPLWPAFQSKKLFGIQTRYDSPRSGECPGPVRARGFGTRMMQWPLNILFMGWSQQNGVILSLNSEIGITSSCVSPQSRHLYS
jgi:hypothetical protein